jgi:BNR/Asp-box repeat protein
VPRPLRHAVALCVALAGALIAPASGFAASASYSAGTISNLSASSCSGSNAEVEQAVDPRVGYVYEEWMGCSKIALSRSVDGGRTFGSAFTLPASVGSNLNAWDPALTVAPDGTLYAAFMVAHGSQWYPVVDTSFDHGASFTQVSSLIPPDAKNWGDRPFIAVAPDGTVYVTWDYGPQRSSVTEICATNGSCAFATGDLNVVVQRSTDHGKTWSAMSYVSPGFPASGGDLAPILVEPSGRVDVIYQGYHITDPTTFAMEPAFEYFTASVDQGRTWSAPIQVGPEAGTMSLAEWWIDSALSRDAGGNLYASWDTQGTNSDGSANDVGWLAFSNDGGRTWSAAIQATPDSLDVPHIMEVAGGASGIAYVSLLSNSDPRGYALMLRTFSISRGWLSGPFQVSTQFGDPNVWPGDTTGINDLGSGAVAVSWGSATAAKNKKSDIFASRVTVQLR